MGMDVMGVNPKSEVGEYFRNNVWWWRPLATYCLTVAPEVCDKLSSMHPQSDVDFEETEETVLADLWFTNDGFGLNADDSKELAEILIKEISDGTAAKYQKMYESKLENMPDECCDVCDGAGTVLRGPVATAVGTEEVSACCHKCKGTGQCRPFVTNYPFSAANVLEFTAFLEDCGGFQIL